jgi:hypothetical protein
VGELLFAGDSEGNIIVWNVDKAIRLHKMKFSATKYRNSNATAKAIRGIALSYDENTVLIHSRHKLAYFSLSDFREEKSQDVYKKYGIEEGASFQRVS